MPRKPSPRNWKSETMAQPLTSEATPDAAAALLLMSLLWPEAAAITPYCGCAHEFDGLTHASLETRHLAVMVAPGAVHGRAGLGVSWGGAAFGGPGATPSTTYHAMQGASSGGGGANEIWETDPSFQAATYGATWTGFTPLASVQTTSDNKDNNPANAGPRRFELTTQGTPYVEAVSVTVASSFSLTTSHQLADLELL